MENAQKAIMIGVGLFITIIIIAAVMLITGMGQDLLNRGTEQLGGISGQLEQQLTSQYDNTEVSGSQVLSALQKYYNDTSLVIYVQNKGQAVFCSTPKMYGTSDTSPAYPELPTNGTSATIKETMRDNKNQPTYGTFTSQTNLQYRIVTTGRYSAYLIKNTTGSTAGVYFVQK